MPKCEKCQMRDARVRLDGIVNGRRESHLFCQECAEELMRGAMDPMDGAMGGALGGLEATFLPNEGAGFWSLISMGAILGGTMRSPFKSSSIRASLTLPTKRWPRGSSGRSNWRRASRRGSIARAL